MKKCIISFLLIPILMISVFVVSPRADAAEQKCISRLRIAAGEDAAEKLESDGYTVFYQNLNPSGDADKKIYLGYKLGEKAVTGLAVSSSQRDSLRIGSVSYLPVSSFNLNEGTDGKPVYLYSTTDSKAGSGIISFCAASDNDRSGEAPLKIMNDGSVPVRTEDGSAADLEAGIADGGLYLFTVHENLCLPYISEIKTVTVPSNGNAFEKIVSSSCNYFAVDSISSSKGDTYICYNRTADASEAVRNAVVSADGEPDGEYILAGSYSDGGKMRDLYYTKDESAGNPLTDITKGAVMGREFTLGDWALTYFSGDPTSARAQLFSRDEYKALLASEEKYVQTQVEVFENGKQTGTADLFMVFSQKGLNVDEMTTVAAQEETTQADENAADGLQRDTADESIVKNDSDEQTTTTASTVQGSAISKGSVIAVACLAVVIAAAAAAAVIIGKRKNKKK